MDGGNVGRLCNVWIRAAVSRFGFWLGGGSANATARAVPPFSIGVTHMRMSSSQESGAKTPCRTQIQNKNRWTSKCVSAFASIHQAPRASELLLLHFTARVSLAWWP